MKSQTKVYLKEDEMPRKWYNLAADLPSPMLPPLGPDGKPVTPDQLEPIFSEKPPDQTMVIPPKTESSPARPSFTKLTREMSGPSIKAALSGKETTENNNISVQEQLITEHDFLLQDRFCKDVFSFYSKRKNKYR